MGLKSCQADVVIGAGPGEIGQGRCSQGGERGGEGGGEGREQRLGGGGEREVLQDALLLSLQGLGQILWGWELPSHEPSPWLWPLVGPLKCIHK